MNRINPMKELKYFTKDDKKVYFKGEKKEWEKELLEYRESDEHRSVCNAYHDQTLCCLDKEWIWKFIERILTKNKMCDIY